MTAAFTPPEPSDGTGFDPRAFRTAPGHFPTGVTVMTARAGDLRAGVTAHSFSTLSPDPPLVLSSIIKASSSFARPGQDRFEGQVPEEGVGGVPLLPGSCAWLECARHQIPDGGITGSCRAMGWPPELSRMRRFRSARAPVGWPGRTPPTPFSDQTTAVRTTEK